MAWRLTRRGVDSPSSILSRTQVAGAHRHLHGVVERLREVELLRPL
jgi:hypothetical protein